jgi:germacradienol/geosmin synthase
VLADTFADAVHLRNDLFSYQREVQQEGENSNAVLVFERFGDYPVQRAADLVGDLLTSRLQQFEHTTLAEALFAEHDLGRPAREALTRHVGAMRDWMSAVLEWHRKTTRYTDAELRRTHLGFTLHPTGLGTAAARIPTPVR